MDSVSEGFQMMCSMLATLDFRDALLIAAGLILGFAVINATRWLLSRRQRVRLPESFLVEMSRFARRFKRSADQMCRLSKLMEHPTRLAWKARNAEILRTLRQMNKLLQQLNDFFELKIQDYESPRAQASPDASTAVDDFSHPEEKSKFSHMDRITEKEIASTDWDHLLDRLQGRNENSDTTD